MTPPPDLTARAVSLYHKLTWANALRQNYRRAMAREAPFMHRVVASNQVSSYEECFRSEMYMCLWFSTLYIVVEGWPSLRQKDPALTELLRSPSKNLLKDFRDATLHPTHWHDERYDRLIGKGIDAEAWVEQLTDAFLRFFEPLATLDRARRRRLRRPTRRVTA